MNQTAGVRDQLVCSDVWNAFPLNCTWLVASPHLDLQADVLSTEPFPDHPSMRAPSTPTDPPHLLSPCPALIFLQSTFYHLIYYRQNNIICYILQVKIYMYIYIVTLLLSIHPLKCSSLKARTLSALFTALSPEPIQFLQK